jgi:hypothetical protein
MSPSLNRSRRMTWRPSARTWYSGRRGEMLALQRHGDSFDGPLGGTNRPGSPGDVIGEQQQPARAQHPGHLADRASPPRDAQVGRSAALLRAGRRPRAEQHGIGGHCSVPLLFVPHPLLKRLYADLIGSGHSGAHDQRHGGTHVLHCYGDADRIAGPEVWLDSDHPQGVGAHRIPQGGGQVIPQVLAVLLV